MNREEAMTLLTSLHLIHAGMTGAGIELLIQIVQVAAKAEREACAKVCELIAREIDDTNGLATYCAAAIRARGQT